MGPVGHHLRPTEAIVQLLADGVPLDICLRDLTCGHGLLELLIPSAGERAVAFLRETGLEDDG
jgi:hypothetical protein